MIRRFTAQAFPYLLAFSLLMLVVGSAWHVHDHDHGEADSCVWCLAAMVVVVLALTMLLTDRFPSGQFFTFSILQSSFASLPWSPRASRAPPYL